MNALFITLVLTLSLQYTSVLTSDSSIDSIQDTTIDFSNSQRLVTGLSNQFQATFSDIEELYTDMLFDTNMLTMTNSEELAANLESIASLVRERMAQSEEAASHIKQAAEAINTAQNNQDYLRDAACESIEAVTLLDWATHSLYVNAPTKEQETNNENSDPSPINQQDTQKRYTTSNLINTQHSQVVTPVYIYECSGDAKRDIWWTQSLDSVFTQNSVQLDKVGHQYFGSAAGVLRMFPATNFSMGLPYDQRMQPYYTQSATLPKVVIIALDSSGSVNGEVTALMENTLDTILDLLTDSDLVALFFFKNDYVYLLPTAEELRQQCEGTDQTWFVPATLQFKQAFKSAVFLHDNFNSTAEFDIVFEQAETIFDNVAEADYCTKLLILISDGGKGAATESGGSLTRLTDANPDLHLVIFLIGPDVFDTKNDDMHVLACAANGFFYRVAHEASIRYTIAEMLVFLSRQLSLSQFNLPTWSSLHMQPWVSDYSPVISVTFPVYYASTAWSTPSATSQSQDSSSTSTDTQVLSRFIGVSGVDLEPLRILQDIGKTWWSQSGNLILVNNKGTVVFDQNLATLAGLFSANNQTLELPQVYVEEMFTEYPDDSAQFQTLTQAIVLGSGNSQDIQAQYTDLPGSQYVHPIGKVKYTWSTIQSSNDTQDFHLVQRLVEGTDRNQWRIEAKLGDELSSAQLNEITQNAIKMVHLDINRALFNESNHDLVGLTFSSENYCPGLNYGTSRFDSAEMTDFISSLVENSNFPMIEGCKDNPQYWNLIYDLHFLYTYIQDGGNWINTLANQGSFIKTHSGVLLYRTASNPHTSLGYTAMWETLRNNRASVIMATQYIQNSDQIQAQIRVGYNYAKEQEISSECYGSTNTHWELSLPTYLFPLLITKPLFYNYEPSQVNTPFAVAGFLETQLLLESDITAAFPDCFNTTLWCYFLDEGGFIVFNSQGYKLVEDLQTMYPVGINLYNKDPCLMNQLVTDGFYQRFQKTTKTCSCDAEQVLYQSSAEMLRHFLGYILTALMNFINFMQCISFGVLKNLITEAVYWVFVPKVAESLELGPNDVQLCEQKVIKFAFGDTQTKSANLTNCTSTCACSENEIKPYFARRIENTNLLLVSVRNSFDQFCSSSCPVDETRVSIVDETKLFDDTLRLSMRDNGPVQEEKVNTCNYQPRVQADQKRGCIPTWSDEEQLFPECDNGHQIINSKSPFLYSIVSILAIKMWYL